MKNSTVREHLYGVNMKHNKVHKCEKENNNVINPYQIV